MPDAIDLTTNLLRLEVDDAGVATLRLDDPEASVNKISEATLTAFEEAVDGVQAASGITGLVFISGKPESFIVGADLDMIRAFERPAEARALSRRAHRLGLRVQDLSIPTVAAIHGPAMGGGLEMALNCDYRIATTGNVTKLALPEVNLGLLPGGGGTQLLPRLVGVQQALTLMLTGKNAYPEKAERIGLVDTLIHPPGLHRAARQAAIQLSTGELSLDQDDRSLGDQLLESNTLSRRVIYRQAAQRTEARTHGNYPAPPRIIDAVRTGMEKGIDAGLDAETRHFGDLVFTRESKALVSLFFGRRRGEDNPHSEQARPVDTVGVLGAGLMGSGIAQVTAENGVDVLLKDQSLDLAAEGKQKVWSALSTKEAKGIINRFTRDQIAERVVPTDRYTAFDQCDLVIEAVPEDLDLKHDVISAVEEHVSDDAVIATNTSSIPVSDIAEAADRPERVLGMHYFSPVPDIPLLEIVTTETTSDEALATAYEMGLTQDKTVIVVNDGPGFYTTRILALYMNEALLLLEEGAEIDVVDEAMEDAGFPMGPYELLDFVGLDVAAKITEVMGRHLDANRVVISDTASTLSAAGLLGQKNGRGFYRYPSSDDGEETDPEEVNDEVYGHLDGSTRSTPSADTIQSRLLLIMVNEAIRCLEEGILRDATDGDIGAVFGLGFPPFLGGPFRYVDTEGPEAIESRLQQLAAQHGDRFRPAERLSTHAADGTFFHDE